MKILNFINQLMIILIKSYFNKAQQFIKYNSMFNQAMYLLKILIKIKNSDKII